MSKFVDEYPIRRHFPSTTSGRGKKVTTLSGRTRQRGKAEQGKKVLLGGIEFLWQSFVLAITFCFVLGGLYLLYQATPSTVSKAEAAPYMFTAALLLALIVRLIALATAREPFKFVK